MLIHSILANYPIPPIYCFKKAINKKEDSYSIFDGKERLTTIFDYIDGRYPFDEETLIVVIEDTTYELGGKYFTNLPLKCQQKILPFKFLIYCFEDAEDDLIVEIFYRLNNNTPLSKSQKIRFLIEVKNVAFFKSILSDRFFSQICSFSVLQRRKSDDMCTLLQTMMLFDDKYKRYEFTSFSAEELMKYASYLKENSSEKQKEHLFDIIDYLEKAFPEKEK